MGLFSDICPGCGNKVSKRARFCSKCGRGAPDGWTKCPQCGKWIGNDSKFCPHCNHRLYPEDRVDLAGGVWAREPGEFARRFELDDVRFIKENGLMVQEGTVAVLLDGGKEVTELGPGRHTPLGTLRTINWFGNPPPRAAVMIDAGECVFRVDFTGSTAEDGTVVSAPLRSAEELAVECTAEITLRYAAGKAEAFIANVMKGARSITASGMCSLLYENALSAVRDLCLQSRMEDLVKDPARRERFEDAISRALRDSLKAWGLELVRVGAVEFYGPAYEEMRAKYGELEEMRRRMEFEKAKLDLFATKAEQDAADGKRDAKRDFEMQEYLAQLAQEKELSALDREKEMKIATLVANGELSVAEAKESAARELEEHARRMTALAHKLELDLALKNYDREQLLADAENKAKLAETARAERLKDEQLATRILDEKVAQAEKEDAITGIHKKREIWEMGEMLSIRERKNAIKNAELRERSDILMGKSELELAALAEDDPEAKKMYLELALAKLKLQQEAAMTPEQLLAKQAGASSAAAEALARMAESKEKASAQVLDERRQMDAERHSHDEKTLSQMAGIANNAIDRQTTVVPPAPVTNMQH